MSVKLMGVPGPKLMPDERLTQDLITVSTPTFVTPDTRENAKLHRWGFRGLPIFYFLNPLDTHLIDFFMQSLWNETQYNPLATRYWSCVPYLLGEGQAMVYSFRPKSDVITDIPGVPFGRVPPNYLRDNLIATLARRTPSSTSWSRSRPTRTSCRSRTRAYAGQSGCRRSCRWRRSTSPSRTSTPRPMWSSTGACR